MRCYHQIEPCMQLRLTLWQLDHAMVHCRPDVHCFWQQITTKNTNFSSPKNLNWFSSRELLRHIDPFHKLAELDLRNQKAWNETPDVRGLLKKIFDNRKRQNSFHSLSLGSTSFRAHRLPFVSIRKKRVSITVKTKMSQKSSNSSFQCLRYQTTSKGLQVVTFGIFQSRQTN